uniref:Hbs1-like protein n=1 Tax=Triatoma infestans TaxID=30076 RepID=A0A170ZZB4_TRIIF
MVEAPVCTNLLKWYKGPTLLEVIDKFKCPERPVSKPLRVSVNDIYKGTGSGFCVSGRVETGMVQVGDKVLVQPQNETALVKAITIDEQSSQKAFAGDYISVTLANFDQQNIAIGYILSDPTSPTPVSSKFEARIVVFNTSVPITRGYPVVLHIQSLSEQAVITKLIAQLNKSTGDIVKQRPRCLLKNSNAMVIIETSKPICIELYRDMKELGRFMLRVSGVTIAAGLITKIM